MLSLIVAMSLNHVIGHANRLPWHLPADLRFFKRMTLGKPIVMGRRTFESIGRPLPDRINIVVTRRQDYRAEGCQVVHSLPEALAIAEPAAEIMLIGGASLYALALERAERIYLTLVAVELEGDTWFPALDWAQWQQLGREDHPADARHAYPYSFILLERRYAPTAAVPNPESAADSAG